MLELTGGAREMLEWMLIVSAGIPSDYQPVPGFANFEDCSRMGMAIYEMKFSDLVRKNRPECKKQTEDGYYVLTADWEKPNSPCGTKIMFQFRCLKRERLK